MAKTFERRLRIIELIGNREYTSTELEINLFGTRNDPNHRRNIEKDLEVIKSYFIERYRRVKRGKSYYYSILGLSSLWSNKEINDPEEISKLYEFFVLFDLEAVALLEEDRPVFIGDLKKDIKQVYHFISQPYEQLPDIKIKHLKKLKEAIKEQKLVNLGYQKESLILYTDVIPLKIIFSENNWYLAVQISKSDTKTYTFTYLRISLIVSVDVLVTSYKNDATEVKDALDHIKDPQTLFALPGKKSYEVELLAQRSIARYFKQKKYLTSQKVVQNDDGSIVLTYRINTDKEILPLIQKWLPDIYVLKPRSLQKKVSRMLQRYLDRVEKLHEQEG